MTRVRFTSRAREDLLGIWSYIGRRNLHVADRVYDRIEASCNVLADHPRFGAARPDIGEGARVLVIERWLALYRLVDGMRDLTGLHWLHGGDA